MFGALDVEIANDTVYGLGAHVQGEDLAAARAVAARIRSRQVHINYPAWSPNAPFGGYGAGHLIADIVSGAEPIFDPKPFDPARFNASAWGKVADF